MKTDFTKTIAVSLAYINSELAKRQPEIIEAVMSDVAGREEKLLESIHLEIARHLDEIEFPAQDDSHLHHIQGLLNNRIDESAENIRSIIEELDSTTKKLVEDALEKSSAALAALKSETQQADSGLENRLSELAGGLKQTETELLEQISAANKHQANELFLKAEELTKLLNGLDQAHSKAREQLQTDFQDRLRDLVSSTETTILALSREFRDQDAKLSERIDGNDKTLKDLQSAASQNAEFSVLIDNDVKNQSKQLSSLEQKLEKTNDRAAKATKRLEERLSALQSKTEDWIEGVAKKSLGRIESALQGIEKTYATKLQLKELSKELKTHSSKLFESYKQRIPKDGKDGDDGEDAYQWEFKFHERRRGLLMYRREDWKEWRTQDLLGPVQHLEPPSGQPSMPVYGGGMVGGGNTYNFGDSSTNLHVGNTPDSTLSKIFVGTTTTASDGTFEISFVDTGINQPHGIHVSAAIMTDDPSLDIQERIVEVHYNAPIGDGKITGVAFFNRKVVGLLGGISYVKVPVGAGVTIRVTVIGNITL